VYFWNTKKLANDIKDKKVGEKAKLYYYLIAAVVIGSEVYFETILEEFNTFGFLSFLLVFVIGTLITFRTNKGENGEDYIARVIMLSLPINIKIMVAFLVSFVILFVGLSEGMFDYSLRSEAEDSILALINMFVFWRINVHLKYINE
jgi:hypothetical protein